MGADGAVVLGRTTCVVVVSPASELGVARGEVTVADKVGASELLWGKSRQASSKSSVALGLYPAE